MQIGRFLVTNTQILTRWFPRRADNAVFSYELIDAVDGGETLTVKVFHKNLEDIGTGSQLSLTWSTGSLRTAPAKGLKELVRFRIEVINGAGVLYRILEPTWFDSARPPAS